ncbi:MAG TPA: hypothetical protein VKV27_16305 [Solirubrobacteraceae bacterium]|nr:hypothetical protein [Solirubrobacteraceae bacterium]
MDDGQRRRLRGALAVGALALVVAAAAVDLVVLASSNSRPPPGAPIAGTTATAAAPPPPAQQPGLPAPAAEVFGVSVNRLFNDASYTPAQLSAQLASVRATGATVARTDALWEATEPLAPVDGHHHYNWAFDDAIARALAEHDLTWLPIIDYTAPYNQSIPGQDHSPPLSDVDYADYAAAFAGRYGPGGSFWSANPDLTPRPVTAMEIWNEPDNAQFWLPGPDPGAYADLYLTARAAIQRVDPSMRVLIGGLVDPATFLPAMVRARPLIRGHVDGVAIHPYGSPGVVLAKVRAARATLVSLGMGSVPLYVTEFGWTVSPPGAPDYAPSTVRDGYITQTLDDLGHLSCGLAAAVLYTWVTPEVDPRNAQDWYGIADPSGAGGPTPATRAFAAGLEAAAGPPPADAPAPCPG